MEISEKLWINFRHSLEKCLRANKDGLKAAWDSSTDRTIFYTKNLLPEMANALGFYLEKEFLNVDYALFERERKVPLVFIESENNAWSIADNEMRKLCAVSSPLKVLITVIEWCEDPGYWECAGHKTRLLDRWKSVIKEHNEKWPQKCLYGIVIGERDDEQTGEILRFYTVALASNGTEIDRHIVLVEL
jgi:hypothetical protein